MRKKYRQTSLLDTYKSVEEHLENNKPELFLLLDEHLDWEMDKTLADMLVYDTTGIESYVAENSPKFMGKMAAQSRSIAKLDPSFDPSGGAAALLPKAAASSPAVKQQYINGHFCYAQKAAVVANGLGIVRHLELFDDDFKAAILKYKSKNAQTIPLVSNLSVQGLNR